MHSLQIYPNPSDGLFAVETSVSGPVEIHNINGQLLLNTNFIAGINNLNLKDFKKGIYLLKFNGKVHKLVLN